MKKQKKNNGQFKFVDPRGKIIICEDDGLCHAISGHKEVTVDQVKESIENPDYIRESKHSEKTNLYYSIEDTSENVQCFVSVVKFTETTKGYFCTAYQEKNDTGSKGKVIWIKK